MACGQRHGKPSNQVFTSEYYRKRLHRFANGPRAKLYADSTNIRLSLLNKMWQEYCLFSEQDPHRTLEECSVEVLENFLHWILNNTEIKKQSSLQTYWRYFGLLYAKQMGRQMDKLVAKEIQACINSLTAEHNLGVMDGPKPLLDVNDLFTILRYHWTSDCRTFSHERLRVQLALILLVAAYTATRPGAIVERPHVKGSNKVLCYKDIKLTILRNPELGKRDVLVMEVTLFHMKGGQGQKKPQDVQASYLRCPSEDALIKIAGQMSRSLDPRLLRTFNVDQLSQVDFHLTVQALSHSKQIIRAEILLQYGKIKNAVGTPIYDEYMRAKQNFKNEKAYQKKALLKELRNRHHREAPMNDIQQQLNGSLTLDLDRDVPGTVAHTFAERSRIAKAFFPLKTDEDYGRRVEVIKDLVALCGLREGRRRPVHKDDNKSGFLQLQSFSLKCKPLQCVFCLGDESLGNRREESLFSRKDALRRHVEVAHLGGFTENGEIYCGHPVCKEAKLVLAGVSHFRNHVAGVFM